MTLDVLAPALRLLSRAGAQDVTIGAAVIEDWPTDLLAALLKERIVTACPVAQSTICPGCARNCMMEVTCLGAAGLAGPSALIVCDKSEDYGIINIDSASLQQWRWSRPDLIRFLANQFGLRAKSANLMLRFISFGTSKRLMRPIALEFADAPKLTIGDEGYDLVDLLICNEGRIQLDWELLSELAYQKAAVWGSRNYQKSTVNREIRKYRTKLRDRDLQAAMDLIRASHPRWNKARCAREVGKGCKVSCQRIMRVTRVRK